MVDVAFAPAFNDILDDHAAITGWESVRNYADERLRNPDKVSAELMDDSMKRGLAVTFERYVAAQRKAVAFKAHVDSLFDKVDVLLCPSAPGEAPEGLGVHRRPALQLDLDAGRHALRHPAGRHGRQGLPLGVQLVGLRHDDDQLLSTRRLGRGASRLRLTIMPKINGERLLADLRRIADFGRYETGVHRPHLSPQDVESRHWLAGRMKEAGLEPVIDGIGTVIGRSPKTGPRLLIGSHSDTQPRGGWLDGVMGVIYGLEVARALAEDPETAHLAVDVASWADEEGHWGQMTGSRSFIGMLSEADIDKARHRDEGTPMRDALKAAGLDKTPREHLEEGRYRGYLEAHIEQGGLLEASDKRIGIVTAIVGIYVYRLTFSGIQNHAGTTPMPIRKDAGVAMMRLYNEVMDTFPTLSGPRSVWTVGKMSVEPGAPAIIPGKAEMILQFRDADTAVLDALRGGADWRSSPAANAKGPCTVECVNLSTHHADGDGRPLPRRDRGGGGHRMRPDKHVRMPSGAGHDAQILGLKLPAAMMFVPSIGGISHHFTENTEDADIVLGCQVFADATAKILKGN